MYSQCPECRVIFNVPEAYVSASAGLVRCGYCRAVFHADTNAVPAPATAQPAPESDDTADSDHAAGALHRPASDLAPPAPPAAEANGTDETQTQEPETAGSETERAPAPGTGPPEVEELEVEEPEVEEPELGPPGTPDPEPTAAEPALPEAPERESEERLLDALESERTESGTRAGEATGGEESGTGTPEQADPVFQVPDPPKAVAENLEPREPDPDRAGSEAPDAGAPGAVDVMPRALAPEPLEPSDTEQPGLEETEGTRTYGVEEPPVEQPGGEELEVEQPVTPEPGIEAYEPGAPDPGEDDAAAARQVDSEHGVEAPESPAETASPGQGDTEDAERGEAGGMQEPSIESGEAGDAAGSSTEPVPPQEDETKTRPGAEHHAFEGEVEEILIEAPAVLWNVSDDDLESHGAGTPREAPTQQVPEPSTGETGEEAPAPRRAAPLLDKLRARARREASPDSAEAGQEAGRRRAPMRSPYSARDVRMVELPQPRPLKMISLALLSVLLVVALIWQLRTFYIDELAQAPVLRPYLEVLCGPLGCVLPPRHDFAQIDLVGTSISINPEVPGALAISVSLINRADYPQPYPLLRVTLTDKEGRIVGRRTYPPSAYRQGDAETLLPSRDARDVSINLAQPAEDAVGYEVELVAPHSENS